MAAGSMIETPGICYAGGDQPQFRVWPGLPEHCQLSGTVKIRISARQGEVFELPTPWLISDRMLVIGERQFRIMPDDSMSWLSS
jgi:hypothetical protein